MYSKILVIPAVVVCVAIAVQGRAQQQSLSVDRLELHSTTAQAATYRGVKSVEVKAPVKPSPDDASGLAVVRGTSFEDGTIEVRLSGDTVPDADPQQRGFVGIAFRVSKDRAHYECFYLRPRNGRAEDQLQRNHSVQYISVPDFPWYRLRKETPGKYETYVDLVPGEWTRVKIQVKGSSARLYVNGAAQPTLIVNDLKLAPASGAIALWVGPGTLAHFAELKVGR